MLKKAIEVAQIAVKNHVSGARTGGLDTGAYQRRPKRMTLEDLDLDLTKKEAYKRLLETMNSIDSDPFGTPLRKDTRPSAPPSKESNKPSDPTPSTSSPLSPKLLEASSGLNLKISMALSKESLKTAEEDARKLEIEALHKKLDTLEVTRMKGDDEELEELLKKEEEEERRKKKEKKVKVSIKKLSPELEGLYMHIMSRGESMDTVISKHKQLQLCRSDMLSLGPGQWLTDENINFYMSLLNDRAQRMIKDGKGPKCYFTNTFFFNKLYRGKKKYEYKGVRKWTKKVKIGVNTTECDKIIVPIHQQVHWCCAVVDVSRRQLVYYDSMLGKDQSVLESLAQWIQDEMKDKADLDINTSDWERRYPEDIPIQQNGYDCGVFAVKFAEYSGLDAILDFSQSDMPLFRKQMVVQLTKVDLEAIS